MLRLKSALGQNLMGPFTNIYMSTAETALEWVQGRCTAIAVLTFVYALNATPTAAVMYTYSAHMLTWKAWYRYSSYEASAFT